MNPVVHAALRFEPAGSGDNLSPLPCRLLVLADLGLTAAASLQPLSTLGHQGINKLLEHLQPQLQLELPDLGTFNLTLRSLDDLHPGTLLPQLLAALPGNPAADDFTQLQQERQALYLVNRLLHHPRVRQLEATWRNLDRLVRQASNHPGTELLVMHLDRETLQSQLTDTPLVDSPLFQKIYAEELGQYGGQPYSLLLPDYSWNNSQQDLQLLLALARLGQAAHAPVLTAAAPGLLGLDAFTRSLAPDLAQELAGNRRHTGLRSLMQQPASHYLYLLLPRILVRPPYRIQLGQTCFQEQALEGETALLWGNPAYSLASLVLRSFQQHGGYTGLLASPGDEDTLLPPYQLNENSLPQPPLETRWPQETLAAFARQGLTLAGVSGQGQHLAFEQPVSLHAGASPDGRIQPDHQLPYLLTACRVAHYLKRVMREQLGSSETLQSLENRLNLWLQGSVSAQEKPAPEVLHRKPFREARLQIDNNSPDQPQIHLQLTPHLRHQGQGFTLNLTSSLAGDTHG